MVFRTLFGDPRPKGFLELGEVLDELDIDTDDDDRFEVEIGFEPKDVSKFDEVIHGFYAEVRYHPGDGDTIAFTTLGYRALDDLIVDLRAANLDPRDFEYTFSDEFKSMRFTDEPDESMVTTIVSKSEDFAEIRDQETFDRIKALGDRFKSEIAFAEEFGASEPCTVTMPLTKENPDMTIKHEIFTLIGSLTVSVMRAQNELIEVSRIAQEITNKLGQEAFNDPATTDVTISMNIDTAPFMEVLEELQARVSTGVDAEAQGAVEASKVDYVGTKDIIEDAAIKATAEAIKKVEDAGSIAAATIPDASDDFDAAFEGVLASKLAVEMNADKELPKPLPKSVPSVGLNPAPPIVAEPIDQSEDAKDFRAVVQYFLSNHAGERDNLTTETTIFNMTWDFAAKRIKSDLVRNLVKVAGSKMIWTARLNKLFKNNIDTTVDVVLYGTTTPVTMKLTKDIDGTYSFIKV